LVCSGRHSNAFTPRFVGREQFRGTFLHSASYKNPGKHDLKGKTVVVIGIGNSGADIACELASVASRVHLVSRSGAFVFDLKGVPLTSFGQGGRLLSIIIDLLP
jgi:dimethylaniline monooxygenase (N-oxide forming)